MGPLKSIGSAKARPWRMKATILDAVVPIGVAGPQSGGAVSRRLSVTAFSATPDHPGRSNVVPVAADTVTLRAMTRNANTCTLSVVPAINSLLARIDCSSGAVSLDVTVPKSATIPFTKYVFSVHATNTTTTARTRVHIGKVLQDAPLPSVINGTFTKSGLGVDERSTGTCSMALFAAGTSFPCSAGDGVTNSGVCDYVWTNRKATKTGQGCSPFNGRLSSASHDFSADVAGSTALDLDAMNAGTRPTVGPVCVVFSFLGLDWVARFRNSADLAPALGMPTGDSATRRGRWAPRREHSTLGRVPSAGPVRRSSRSSIRRR